MHISRLELENIKSYAAANFEFSRGTTAITGHNGAGKTTIIEAIAWVLFDLLEYKKDEFVRRGEKKGWVRLTLVSGLDEREYIIYRDTGAGYHVTDPQLNQRIADKKDEVFRFLWQHLGLEPGTDLKSLFRQAIGVPQGTFTAIFLDGTTERKVAFDRLLKVEEYRQAAEKLRETSRYLDTQVAGIRENLARSEGQLARVDLVNAEFKSVTEEIAKLETDVEALSHAVTEKANAVKHLDELERLENALNAVRTEKVRVTESLDNISKSRTEIETLKPKAAEQETLEKDVNELRSRVAVARSVATQITGLETRLARLRESYLANQAEIRNAEANSAESAKLADLEILDAELLSRIASSKAELERDKRFQSEIKNGFCPILSQKCLNLAPGQSLDDFVSSQFGELTNKISAFETERKTVSANLQTARAAAGFAAKLETLRAREGELSAEGKHLKTEQDQLQSQIAVLPELENDLASLEAKAAALGDPRGRIKYLENELGREPELRDQLSKVDSNIERLSDEHAESIEQLENIPGVLDPNGKYDRAIHLAVRTELREIERRNAELGATLTASKRRESQLSAEIEHFAKLRESLATELREKERLEKVAEMASFIRDTLKEAAPRVARNYVYHVSLEANLMFREITGNAEQTLKWGEDYAIMLEEGGHERPFVSLSGGEQMAAALSVRLALLKQLTDIRIAFFDEPTTNMDAERRENLAMQISRITHFDQLFVISHDDTFDNYVDNVLSLENGA